MTGSTSVFRNPSEIELSGREFWELPREERFAAFDLLRSELPVSRQAPPVAWAPAEYGTPSPYWAVMRHADIVAASRDAATFISGDGVLPFDSLPREIQYLYDGFLGLDAPRHSKLRRLVSTAFTPRMMRRIEDWIERQARRSLAQVAERGECDFYQDLARPFPINVICDMLGVPSADRAEVLEKMEVGVSLGLGEDTVEDSIQAARDVVAYGTELGRHRAEHPGEDLMTGLVQAEVDGERLGDLDLGATFWLILTGGGETTGTTAAHSLLALSRNPDERRRWQSDYEGLAQTAVEELLRWGGPIVAFRRVATRPVEISGQPIAAGESVLLFYEAGNRDETVFDDPYRFDLSREPNPHLGFGGGGVHFCLGNALARTELKTLFRELFRELPDIDVAGDPVYEGNPVLDMVASLPCSYTPTTIAVD